MPRDDLKSLRRVYFVVTSKEGFATLSIEHGGADQQFTLPVYPSASVSGAAPLLEPAFGHYALQWRKVMVDDPDETDGKGFYIERLAAPARIADPFHSEKLKALAWSHMPDSIRD